MKFKEYKTLGAPELKEKLSELKKELMKQNTQRVTGTQLKNPMIIKNLKKDVARINFLLGSLKKKEGKKV
ncbi:50S ribosomal protein L29 [Candidatus Woesearchaeota archaeon]|jgi:large subunit ribosomal protein L29|nr:50S ribosomal protein L29 [Candidatus Woesearchaeota archaeon]MBT5271924.1 50S ribosomal protein L29 [Candidatus Woesearchaeota archaeon]MBT6041036.1 50S ribosomal protein L29 [Candidatus Woesearchaeota archaeon]MBT6336212.1 50S ribosomal protein L29 [Candidatus Woesearchaeota archaeon]MBT7928021.1 50S ribosomal protein L29 [Candidatus Woesearchaeota archaeon]